jgi:hypothetical protein
MPIKMTEAGPRSQDPRFSATQGGATSRRADRSVCTLRPVMVPHRPLRLLNLTPHRTRAPQGRPPYRRHSPDVAHPNRNSSTGRNPAGRRNDDSGCRAHPKVASARSHQNNHPQYRPVLSHRKLPAVQRIVWSACKQKAIRIRSREPDRRAHHRVPHKVTLHLSQVLHRRVQTRYKLLRAPHKRIVRRLSPFALSLKPPLPAPLIGTSL